MEIFLQFLSREEYAVVLPEDYAPEMWFFCLRSAAADTEHPV